MNTIPRVHDVLDREQCCGLLLCHHPHSQVPCGLQLRSSCESFPSVDLLWTLLRGLSIISHQSRVDMHRRPKSYRRVITCETSRITRTKDIRQEPAKLLPEI